MLAGLQGSLHHGKVQKQRHCDEYRVDVVLREQLVVVGVSPRRVVEDLERPLQVLLVDVAKSDAFAVLHMHEMPLKQPAAAAPGPDHRVPDDMLACLRLADERASARGCRDSQRGRCLREVPTVERQMGLFVLGHESLPRAVSTKQV